MLDAIKVTREGQAKLILRKKELFNQLKIIQGKKGEAAEVGGNQWHDNFSFEDLCRQEIMLNKRISDISCQISTAELVGEPFGYETLQIGHIAIFEIDGNKERKYKIAGFGESDLKTIPQKIEYLAPIIQGFIGKEIGTSVKVSIGGKIKEITLIDILQKEN